ncbi:MAG TPA: helix-turn-helix domain-containing protein [Dokdonella sp.]|uniref:helix-turn-helix domain-containing protein n=1 Tax=Dokdonella sp. TaxID=2291710 RepID=UPI002C5BE284|nr:helix-turn-helix domain-containing protein [Dokdonella sp.]HUD41327.1 helix-turn-helix domain-containing protein [Dokdonella sp.]
MHYAEISLPALDGLVKTLWTLRCDGTPDAIVEHDATPDGCLEVIRRIAGRSGWGRAQPAVFVAGLIDRPARLRFSGDAAFVGLRLWPWTWHAFGGRPCSRFVNDWIALEEAGLPADLSAMFATLEADPDPALRERLAALDDGTLAAMGRSILGATTVSALAAHGGLTMRGLQRWFRRHVGIAPRTYLRLLRFQDTLVTIQTDPAILADQAALHGYADQPHMARDFRALAGRAPRTMRKRARGPFV